MMLRCRAMSDQERVARGTGVFVQLGVEYPVTCSLPTPDRVGERAEFKTSKPGLREGSAQWLLSDRARYAVRIHEVSDGFGAPISGWFQVV
jgi:hypothetical protein